MENGVTENDIQLITTIISDTLHVGRNNNNCLYKYKDKLKILLKFLVDAQEENEKLINLWEKEKKFAEEWGIDIPERPILKNIEFSKEDMAIIKETFQETKKEYPTDDLLSTYIGGDVKAFDLDNFIELH
jgi:uncharacterized membrane protein YgaE (UPF0421/DUF939 family)